MDILEIKNLTVKVSDRVILDDLSLNLKAGESYILFGPNGSGKTTLINAIIGVLPSETISGQILFDDVDITGKSVDERSSLGLFVGFQNPPEITGVKLQDLLKLCLRQSVSYRFNEEEKRLIEAFNLTEFLDRDINVGFSGGERKRAEVLQMIFIKPRLMLLDEPDSGVDVESLKLIASEIQHYLQETRSSALIVTHKGDILEYIKSKHGCILLDGKFHCFADPKGIYEDIKKKGYEGCLACRERVTECEEA
ncbi:MAG TPA: ABC transporter ATP-binding protein [Candidatus Bathyarchaeia archaeon]